YEEALRDAPGARLEQRASPRLSLRNVNAPRFERRRLPGASSLCAMSQDVLSDVFQTLKVSSALYGRFEARAPWEVCVHETDVVRFYAVLEGRCRLEVPAPAPCELSAGDLVVLPHRSQHTVCAPADAMPSLVRASYHHSVLEAQKFSAEQHPAPAGAGVVRLVSGRIAFVQSGHQHWWPLLPPLMAMRGRSHALPWLESTL